MSSWNPFTRNTTARKSVGLITTRDFDRETRRLECLEENGKSLTRNLLKQDKAFDDFSRGQLKLLHDLSGSAFIHHHEQYQQTSSQTPNASQLIADWKITAQRIAEQTNLMNEVTTKTVVDSSKRLTLALANVTNAIKKREQSLNEYMKVQAKIDKITEKTGTTTSTNTSSSLSSTATNTKLEQIQRQLNEAKQQYELRNTILTHELPIVHERRAAFVYPCLEAFIEAQAHYCEQLEAAYRSLIGQMEVVDDRTATLDEINTKLASIKALSIVASE